MVSDADLACVILAAGKGTRMQSQLPKVLHPLAGRPMLSHVLEACAPLQASRTLVVIGPEMESVATAAGSSEIVLQPEQRGTGDAVRVALDALVAGEARLPGTVLVLYGDTPLVTTTTLRRMVAACRGDTGGAGEGLSPDGTAPAVVVLGMRPEQPGRYGRLVLGPGGRLERIVEFLDADAAERAIPLCNAGLMAFDGARLPELIAGLGTANAKGEFYLTDCVGVARACGWACTVVETDTPEEVLGVNSRSELAQLEALLQARLRARHMEAGVTLQAPETVYFSADTRIGRDTVIQPHVVFGPHVLIGEDVLIRAFCHLEGVRVAAGAQIGPFARLRPGASLGVGVHIGNFVEVKNAVVEAGAKINHLSYIGDASIGARSNIGAGTITCNYDGFTKHRTEIGVGAFIGSNTALVAPVSVGDGAIVGAGSVITTGVEADALAVGRGRQVSYPRWAERFRQARRDPTEQE